MFPFVSRAELISVSKSNTSVFRLIHAHCRSIFGRVEWSHRATHVLMSEDAITQILISAVYFAVNAVEKCT